MSTETFLRLPEEKRNRILEVAWDEFTRAKFTDVSINKIVLRARIPRGSFYQYFKDKEDLFGYLLNGIQEEMLEWFRQMLGQAGGDLFRLFLVAFDRITEEKGPAHPAVTRYIQLVRLNTGMDIEKILPCQKSVDFIDRTWEEIDVLAFRRAEREYVRLAFSLIVMSFGAAIMESLNHPEGRADQRTWLEQRLDIIKYGCLTAEK